MAKQVTKRSKSRKRPSGETTFHPVSVLPGISTKLKARLRTKGILYAEQLLMYEPGYICLRLHDIKSLSKSEICGKLIQIAKFLLIDGIDAPMAANLVAAGYNTYRDIAVASTNSIRGVIRQGDVNQSQKTMEEVQSIQLGAVPHVGAGRLFVTIVSPGKKKPISGVSVRCNGKDPRVRAPVTQETDSHGLVFFDGLVAGRHYFVMKKTGYKRRIATLDIQADRSRHIIVEMPKGKSKVRIVNEFSGGFIGEIGSHMSVKSRRVKIDQLPYRPPASFVEFKGDKAVLSSLLRRLVDDTIEVLTFVLPRRSLPKKIDKSRVLLPAARGKYKTSRQTFIEFRETQRQIRAKELRRIQWKKNIGNL